MNCASIMNVGFYVAQADNVDELEESASSVESLENLGLPVSVGQVSAASQTVSSLIGGSSPRPAESRSSPSAREGGSTL